MRDEGEGEKGKGEVDEEKRKVEVREVVERDVEMGLKRPEGAVLGGVKAGRGW